MNRSCSRHRRPRAAVCLLLLFSVLAAGCASGKGRWTKDDYHLGYGHPFLNRKTLSHPLLDKAEGGPSNPSIENVSARICLMADSHRHELLGHGIFLYRCTASDQFVQVAIRPPQLDLFGQGLLREALRRTRDFVLHLGDSCDISNTLEFGRFAWDMRLAPAGWLMAPGNHDGFFMGNVSRVQAKWVKDWGRTCEAYDEGGVRLVSRPLQKDHFVSYYLAAVILERAEWSEPLARRIGPSCVAILSDWEQLASASPPPTFPTYWQHLVTLEEAVYRASLSTGEGAAHRLDLSGSVAPGAGVALRRIAWAIHAEDPWRSFVTQEIDISAKTRDAAASGRPISVLLLDSAQYYYEPSMEHAILTGLPHLLSFGLIDLQLAGTHGNLLEEQMESVDWIVDKMRSEGRLWVVATHHPYDALGRNTPPRFDRVRNAGGVPVTLSAHTHQGQIRWNHDGDHEGDWLEINVGSILDAPAEYRDFTVQRVGDRLAVRSRRFVMRDVLRDAGLLANGTPGFRPGPGDPDDYMNYKRIDSISETEAELATKRVLLASYLRMFRLFPTDVSTGKAVEWPTRADGTVLRGDDAVLHELERMVAIPNARVDLTKFTRMLYALREFDRTRPVPAGRRAALHAYRLDQAIWSARAEQRTWPVLIPEVDPDISFFLLPAKVAGPEPGSPESRTGSVASLAATR